jgi:Methyltransferase domain
MLNFKNRFQGFELLDEINNSIDKLDLQQNLSELNTINTLLGGHSITLSGFKHLLKCHYHQAPIIVAEIGCGGADNIIVLAKYCKLHNIEAQFYGIDLKYDCIEFAKAKCSHFDNIIFIESSYELVAFKTTPHIIFNSLFCHHFSNNQIKTMFDWMTANCTIGFFINDLQRNKIGYWSIKLLTQLFSRSYLVKNDAPISVKRGFIKNDFKYYKNNLEGKLIIHWRWAFRFLIIYTK